MKSRELPTQKARAVASFKSAFAERLRHATENHDIAELAAKLGVTPATLYRWLSAKFDPSLAKLAQLAEIMNMNLAWLVSGHGPVDSRAALRHARLENYETTEFEAAEAGSDQPPVAFYGPWLFELLYGTSDDSALFAATDMNPPFLMEVPDDSMEPTISKGDLLLIDQSFGIRPAALKRSQSEGRSPHDGIYAFRLRSPRDSSGTSTGRLVVRRVQYRLDRTMVIRCDNPKYPEEAYPPEARNLPKPLGRAVWFARRI